ncbi:hypothetical protein TIFTF001_035231 [Ficus carica]|uniref:Alginate lyase 2 domain-containing protein n=1 Tax=Ficus carica TaxID=3494 RepID=A0AA88J680_FICCA|nr:hypothetical protein TIFTF001_035231 [Ficus carica]
MIMAAPTDGFTAVNLVRPNNFQLHKPYDQPAQNRYSGATLSPSCKAVQPNLAQKCEFRYSFTSSFSYHRMHKFRGYDYTSGVWQFEGHFVVPSGTTGACIFQVFGAGNGQATTLQLRVYGGNLMIYNSQTIASNIYGKWFKLNVIHDVGNSRVTVFLDDEQKAVVSGRGPSTFYFKYGVYVQEGSSNYMQSDWFGIRVLRR